MAVLPTDQLEVIIQCAENFNPKQFEDVLDNFPFNSLININILNCDSLKLHIILLEKIIKNDGFYKYARSLEHVRHILDFILINIPVLKDIHSNEILSWLLNLLTTIIQKAKDFEKVKKILQNQKEKLFETVSKCCKFIFFNISHVNDLKSVMYEILMLDGYLHDGHSKTFMEIINIFMNFKAHHEISVLSEVVIEKYHTSSEMFSVCSSWLLKSGITFLVKSNEELLLAQLLKMINSLYKKYESLGTLKNNTEKNAIESSINFLTENAEFLISFLTNPNLRTYSAKLFAYVLVAQNLENSWHYFYKKIVNLPVDPLEWVHSDSELFLRICYLLYKNNRIIWPPNKILKVLGSIIYSYQRYSIKPIIMKIMCYLYPLLMADCITKRNAILGDDLMIIISRQYYKLERIFSLHISQLNWILRRGNFFLKKSMICFWLKHNGDLEILIKCILSANMQKLLINLLVDVNANYPISLKVAELIKNIEDPNFKTTIAKMLPVFSDNLQAFNHLMISNPAIPDDKDIALKLAEFMSLIQFFTMDELIFGLICDYSKKLVTHLKKNKNVVMVFCKNSKNILFLVKRLRILKCETAVNSAMGLIKALLLVQQRNHVVLDDSIETDFSYNLKGSSNKIDKCLDVLFLLTTQRLFIKLTPESIFSIFVKLFSLYERPDLKVKSLMCLKEMLKANKWLATLSITNFFVENHCSLAVDEKSCLEFVVFLGIWIKILKNCLEVDKKKYLAHTGIIRNYINRLECLPQSRVNYLLKSLNQLNRIISSTGFHLL